MKKKFKLEPYQKWLGVFLITVSALGVVYKSLAAIDNRYAKSQNVAQTQEMIQKVSNRLDQKIESDTYNDLRQRLWEMKKEYGPIEKIKDLLIKKEMEELEDEIELRKEKLKERIP